MRKLKSTDPKETNFTNKVFGTIQTLIILVPSFALHVSNLQVTEKILITHETCPAFIRVTYNRYTWVSKRKGKTGKRKYRPF